MRRPTQKIVIATKLPSSFKIASTSKVKRIELKLI